LRHDATVWECNRPAMDDGLHFVEYHGQPVLLIDFSHRTKQEIVLLLEETQRTISSQPRDSVLVLADFSETQVDRSVATRIKEVLVMDRPYVKRAAWVGADSLPKVLYDNFRSFSRRDFPIFESREQAMDYLVRTE
jgi:hypothetical protein